MAGFLLLSAAACSASGNATPTSKNAPAAAATITPASGTAKVRPDKGVTVTAGSGVLAQVTVQGGGSTVDGVFGSGYKSWQTKWALKPGTAYTVTAVAKNAAGKTTTATSSFTTLKVSSTIAVSDVTPSKDETVGVGMPIMVSFDRSVGDRAAVEKALEVRSTSPVQGGWRWITDQQVIFRTKDYWPAHSDVSLIAHLSGVRAAAGVYGVKDVTRNFKIGASHIAKVDLKKTHKNQVYVDGQLAKTIAVSGGIGGADAHGNDFRTTSGVHLAMGKLPEVWMTSPNVKKNEAGYYHELVLKDVQISNSGEYLHQSPGEYDCLGKRNCSHGCVRQTPSGAAWFFNLTNRGDVIDISGTSRRLDWQNGWGFWQMSWEKWLAGGAIKQPVMTMPLPPAAQQLAPAPLASASPNN